MRRFVNSVVAHRVPILLGAHALMFALAAEIAFRLRFDSALPPGVRRDFWQFVPWVVALKLAVFHGSGSLHGWWRYVTFADLAGLLKVSTLSMLLIGVIQYSVLERYAIPRSVLLLDWGVTIMLVGGLRSLWRLQREHIRPNFRDGGGKPALLAGCVPGCESIARQIHAHPRLDYRIVGFLTDEPAHHGSRLGGIPIRGRPQDAVPLAKKLGVGDVLVVAGSISGTDLRTLIAESQAAGIRLKVLPSWDDLLSGAYRLQVRDVDIHDLLRRPPVQLDVAGIGHMLAGRCVMVTGAGGSIGSEICRQILAHRPQALVLVERAENSLFHIDRELREICATTAVHACLADISDVRRMTSLFRRYRPHLVFHAAAHKHVPLMEHNPGEAIKNNVLGTAGLADMAERFGVERFVMISTDKAVNPSSVMGATKHLAERYVHACASASATRFVVVRFGNVLASAGSVVPIFQEQIRRGGPVTVTHPNMTRYFMTIPEASQLVLQAAVMGKGGEVYVLNMGEPVRIVDLARDLIRLSGYSEEEIPIQFTGVRPGEKLTEVLYEDDERMLPTPHPKLRVAYHQPCGRVEVLATLEELARHTDEEEDTIRAQLRRVAPDYEPPQRDGELKIKIHMPADGVAVGET